MFSVFACFLDNCGKPQLSLEVCGVPDSAKLAPSHQATQHLLNICLWFDVLLYTPSWIEWREYCQSGYRPANIPAAPDRVYKHAGWQGYSHWLKAQPASPTAEDEPRYTHADTHVFGTAHMYAQAHTLVPVPMLVNSVCAYVDVRALCYSCLSPRAHTHARTHVCARAHTHPLITRITTIAVAAAAATCLVVPNQCGDVCPPDSNGTPLDKEKKGHGARQFMAFEDAAKFARELGLNGVKQWELWRKTDLRPINVPTNPHVIYKDQGWQDWGHWLGNGGIIKKHLKPFLPFQLALVFARSLNLKGVKEWVAWRKTDARPANIPTNPHTTYASDGWQGYVHWLGTRPGGGSKIDASFQQQFQLVPPPQDADGDVDESIDEAAMGSTKIEDGEAVLIYTQKPPCTQGSPSGSASLPEPHRRPEMFQVEAVLGHRITNGVVEYNVTWEGYSAADATWEAKENLGHCSGAIDQYEAVRQAWSSFSSTQSPKQPKTPQTPRTPRTPRNSSMNQDTPGSATSAGSNTPYTPRTERSDSTTYTPRADGSPYTPHTDRSSRPAGNRTPRTPLTPQAATTPIYRTPRITRTIDTPKARAGLYNVSDRNQQPCFEGTFRWEDESHIRGLLDRVQAKEIPFAAKRVPKKYLPEPGQGYVLAPPQKGKRAGAKKPLPSITRWTDGYNWSDSHFKRHPTTNPTYSSAVYHELVDRPRNRYTNATRDLYEGMCKVVLTDLVSGIRIVYYYRPKQAGLQLQLELSKSVKMKRTRPLKPEEVRVGRSDAAPSVPAGKRSRGHR